MPLQVATVRVDAVSPPMASGSSSRFGPPLVFAVHTNFRLTFREWKLAK